MRRTGASQRDTQRDTLVLEQSANPIYNSYFISPSYMVAPSGKSGPKDQVALQVVLLYFAFALVHDSRGIEIASRGKSGPALGGTEYRLMPSACRLIVRAKL